MPSTPTVSYGDAYSIAQLADQWGRTVFFVRQMIDTGKLSVDERGLITNAALHDFHRDHGTDLDPVAP